MAASPPPTSRLARGRQMTALAANHVVRDVGLRVSTVGKSADEKNRAREKSMMLLANQLTHVLGGMKGAAMKVGQMLSVIELPFLPEEGRAEFQAKLAVLRDNAPDVGYDTMRRAIERELGRPIPEVFESFDQAAVAAASIGQVYRGRLHDGRDVAVKIKYPSIDAAVRADIKNLVAFLKFWRSLVPTLASREFLAELRSTLANELDYAAEARNQARMADAYAGHPFIVVPQVVREISTGNMLVTEWFDGEPLDPVRSMPAAERNRLGEILYRFYVGTIYREGEFCGDPHPGNVLVGSGGRVGFVDFGAYKRMDRDARDFETRLWRAGVARRGDEIRALAVARGVIDEDAPITEEDCLRFTLDAFHWQMTDEEIAMTHRRASGVMSVIDPKSEDFGDIRRQTLPPEHLVSRRVDMATAGMLAQLEAKANWCRIASEWLVDAAPATELGRQEQRWRAAR
ncbi:putative ATP-binding protein [Gordonia crocea]|uniref:Putative ATP-binding protein n=2 Tax=Gordonia crocea TaxID=589162 RepID=A0A7M3SVP7_9ACTN|nr:putative ATP-binding protein [Gordonia crocea]